MWMWWYRFTGFVAMLLLFAAITAGAGKETNQMLEYMEDKYQEKFSYIEDYAGQMGAPYKMIRVRSVRNPEREALVRCICGGNAKVMQDNYQSCLLKEKIEETMGLLAQPITGKGSVWYKQPLLVFPEDFPADMEVDAFLRHPQSMVRLYFYPEGKAENPREQVQKLCEQLREKGYVLAATVCWLEDERAPALSFSIDKEGNVRYYEQTGGGGAN